MAGCRPIQQRRRPRRGWLLGHASDSQVRLQAAAERAASKHIGNSRNRGNAGRRPGRSRRLSMAIGFSPLAAINFPTRAMEKLGLHERTALVRYAIRTGLIEP